MRKPVVAGQFYPGTSSELGKALDKLIVDGAKKEDALGVMMPHAGYVYSGRVAGATISAVKIKPYCVILGPNHTGRGTAFSLMSTDDWQTPLGTVRIAKELADGILGGSKLVKEDLLAHLEEHSIEAQLPFLQKLSKEEFKIVPMVVASGDLTALKAVGSEIAQAIKNQGLEKQVLIIASSDMTHYESQDSAEHKDQQAIEAILKLDEDLLFKRVREIDISMCGYAPTIIMLSAVKSLGAKNARLVKYETSAEASGDYSAVVGYAGIIIN